MARALLVECCLEFYLRDSPWRNDNCRFAVRAAVVAYRHPEPRVGEVPMLVPTPSRYFRFPSPVIINRQCSKYES